MLSFIEEFYWLNLSSFFNQTPQEFGFYLTSLHLIFCLIYIYFFANQSAFVQCIFHVS